MSRVPGALGEAFVDVYGRVWVRVRDNQLVVYHLGEVRQRMSDGRRSNAHLTSRETWLFKSDKSLPHTASTSAQTRHVHPPPVPRPTVSQHEKDAPTPPIFR